MNRALMGLAIVALLAACGGSGEQASALDVAGDHHGSRPADVRTEVAAVDLLQDAVYGREIAGEVAGAVPAVLAVGKDIDERITLALSSSYELPEEFYAALEEMEVPPEKLFFPDIGLTADWDMSRLHWTDTIRHEGHRAPTLGYMVIEDVAAAVAQGDTDTTARELLVAQYVYNSRDEFVESRHDVEIAVDPDGSPLLAALKAYYEGPAVDGHPAPPDTEWVFIEKNVAGGIGAMDPGTRVALAQAIRGLMAAADLRDEALLDNDVVNMAAWAQHHANYEKGFTNYSKEILDGAHPGMDFEKMNRAGQLAVRSVESLRLVLTGLPAVPGAVFQMTGPLGTIAVDLTGEDNDWKIPDAFLVVDGGGADTYYDRVAVNNEIYQPVSVVLDLSGNDVYRLSKEWEVGQEALSGPRMPTQGAGIFGIAILDDAAGDDSYRAPRSCQGFAVFGVGLLLDHGGNDEYRGYDYAQGSAEFGYGLLFDSGGGADDYETLQMSQGYGGPRGMGWLVDDGGDDAYLAIKDPIVFDWAGEGTNFSGSQGFAFGFRGGPYWSGGLGALFDLGGNDSYQCAVMCLGFGYFFGTGLFYDATGDDTYVNTHKYTMGSATHQSVGLFIEGGGADSYALTGDDEAIGLGYDHGVAYHIDRGQEDDIYTVDNIGDFVIGFARHPALGALINEGGNDTYIVPEDGDVAIGRSWVDAADRDGPGAGIISLGLFFDLGGTQDTYTIERDEVTNGASWRQTEPLGGGWVPELDFAFGLDNE